MVIPTAMFLGKGRKEENGRESPTQQLSLYFSLKSHMQAWGMQLLCRHMAQE